MAEKTNAQITRERCHWGAPVTDVPKRVANGRNKPIDRSLLEDHTARRSPERIAQKEAEAEQAEVLRIEKIEDGKKRAIAAAKKKKVSTAAAKKNAATKSAKSKATKKAAIKRGRNKNE